MKISTIVLLISLLCFGCTGEQPATLSYDLAPTPPMGWMSWNQFEGDINEDIVKEIADAMVSNGMSEAGYRYIMIDDLWQGERDNDGILQPHPEKFPGGIKALADYVHSKGLKLGIYTDVAEETCAGAVGSLDHEEIDAQTFADWGIDYVKCDYCNAPKDLQTAMKRYEVMAKALQKTGRPIVFSICEWGQRAPWLWGKRVGGQLWRTTWDMRDTWEHGRYSSGHAGIMEILDRQVGLEKFAGPGSWNDPDMLMAGLYGKGKSSNANGAAGCTDTEYRSQMSLWSLLSAPLIACCDIRNMNEATKDILLNKEVIAINQDPLGKQAERIFKDGDIEIWAKKLSDDSWAVGLLNRNHTLNRNITFDFKWIKIESRLSIRDLWKHADLGTFTKQYSTLVKPHETVLVKLSQVNN